ncbi:MAG: ABC transporter ATP-binding protein [Eubacteriales bacterium]|nr:ABC transporter ATP-binding protein [Eubacteriales bacterium]
MLQINNAVKKYLGTTAVNDVTLALEHGCTAALLGPNGSGKTTLMKMIAGLTRPDKGEIRFDGKPLGPASKAAICYMPTENYFYSWMSVRDAGRYYADFFKDFSITRYEEILAREEIDMRKKARALSTGMLAKVKLAIAFSRDSRLTMLDEPLNGIDILARERTVQMIRENIGSRTMLISTHLVDELESMLDVLLFMKDGRLVLSGRREELCKDGATLLDLYRQIYGEVQTNA